MTREKTGSLRDHMYICKNRMTVFIEGDRFFRIFKVYFRRYEQTEVCVNNLGILRNEILLSTITGGP